MFVIRVLVSIFLVLITGCASLRDSSFDHRLSNMPNYIVDMNHYKPVQTRDDGQNPDLAVAAAISGGGHRAANFAVGVLLALENFQLGGKQYDLLKEIDYFSTVSGGGFAAGAYISTLYDYLQVTGGERCGYSFADSLKANKGRMLSSLERDYHGTILGGLFNLRCVGYRDAGDVLEKKFDRYLLGSKYRKSEYSITAGDVFRKKGSRDSVVLPYWVPNATVYENGARFPFTPDVISRYYITSLTHNMKEVKVKNDPFSLPLAAGLKASASFPVAIPATTLLCDNPDDKLNKFLHLMDGGLVDNMGYRTAIDLLKQDKAKRKLLLVIDAYKGTEYPYSNTKRSPAGTESAYRIMKISLDSDHGKLRENIKQLIGDDASIEVVFLSFNQLKPDIKTRIVDIKEELKKLQKEKSDAVVRKLKREINVALKREEEGLKEVEGIFAMYNDVRSVGTSLNISPGEQNLLLKAGKAVVYKNQVLLNKYVFSP